MFGAAFFRAIEKMAALGGNRLRAITGGETPLFHMVNSENVPGFLASKGTVVTPMEAIQRGFLRNREGTTGTARTPAAASMPVPVRTNRFGARVSVADMAQHSMLFNPARGVAAMAGLGSAGDYHVGQFTGLMSPAIQRTAGKSGTQIFVSKNEPMREYGAVGAMLRPSQIQHPMYQRPADASQRTGELSVGPKVMANRAGVPLHLSLPRAAGQLVYDPRAVSREVAGSLKQQGGVPLNARFYRKLRGAQRAGAIQSRIVTPNVETGNITARTHPRAFPRQAEVLRQLQSRIPTRRIDPQV